MKPYTFLLWILSPWLMGFGSCVSPPSAQDVLNTGFRSPEMTFRSFQVGVRGDLPQLEYACFSTGFRGRNKLSQLTYREAREHELKHRIAYWLGIPDANVMESIPLSRDRHLIRAKSHGVEFEVGLVREGFWQLWEGEQLLADEPISTRSFRERAEVFSAGDGQTMVSGVASLPYPLNQRPVPELNRTFTEFRIGREWKIDSITEAEPRLDP